MFFQVDNTTKFVNQPLNRRQGHCLAAVGRFRADERLVDAGLEFLLLSVARILNPHIDPGPVDMRGSGSGQRRRYLLLDACNSSGRPRVVRSLARCPVPAG